jgi:anti-sigma-K factor RskA
MNETSHTGFEANAAAYALGALDFDERREFEAHLSTCARCQADVAQYRQVTVGIGSAIDPIEPPAPLKARVLAHGTGTADDATRVRTVVARPDAAAPPKSSGMSAAWLAAAASLALAIGMGMYAWSLRTQVDTLRRMAAVSAAQAQVLRAELAAVRSDSGRLVRTVNVLTSPDLLRVDLAGTSDASSATGRAFWSRSRGLLFTADRLPALDAGRIYQIWLILPKQPPISAGLLRVDTAGSGTTLGTLPAALDVPRSTNVTVAITNEPAAGSPGPTTTVLLAGSAKTE